MPNIVGSAAQALVSSLRFRMERQAMLAGNVSNADTPGYRRVDLEFQQALGEASQRLERTHPGHLGGSGEGSAGAGHRVLRGSPGTGPDRNGVDLDHELIQMSRNAGAYSDHASVLTRLLDLTKTAIRGEP